MAGSKSFPATQKKLTKSREDGDVARSKFLTQAVAGAFGLVVSWVTVRHAVDFASFMSLTFAAAGQPDAFLFTLLKKCGELLVLAALPPLAAIALAGIGVELAQVGWCVNFGLIVPKWERLAPKKGALRLFGFVEQGSDQLQWVVPYELAKIAVVLFGGGALLGYELWSVCIELLDSPLGSMREVPYTIVLRCLGGPLALVLAIALADMGVEKFRRRKRLMMSVDEYRKEIKESEGSGEVRAWRKELWRHMMERDLIAAVRKSRVIVRDS